MTSNTPLLFAGAILCAATGALAAHLLGPREPSTPAYASGAPALEPSADPLVDLGAEETATRELDRRLGALELAQHASSRADLGSAEDDTVGADRIAELEQRLAALEERLAAGGAARALPLAVNEEMKLQVAEALEEVRMDEAVEKITDRQEREAEALEQRLDKYQAALGLSEGQVSDLRGMFEERQRRERELVQLWRDGADDETMTTEKESLRADLSNQLGEVLSPQQVEEFYELQRGGGGK